MFCPNCGNEVQEGQAFCPNCGNNLNPNAGVNPYQTPNNGGVNPYQTPNNGGGTAMNGINKIKENKRLFIPIIGGIAALIIIIVIVVSCSGGGAKGAVKDYMNAMADNDPKAFASAIYPDELLKEEIDEEKDGDEDEYYDEVKDEMEEMEEDFDKCGVDIDSSYTLTKKGDLSESRIRKINENYKEYHKDADIECTDGAIYKFEQDGAETLYVQVRKINGSWYVYDWDDDFDSDDLD